MAAGMPQEPCSNADICPVLKPGIPEGSRLGGVDPHGVFVEGVTGLGAGAGFSPARALVLSKPVTFSTNMLEVKVPQTMLSFGRQQ